MALDDKDEQAPLKPSDTAGGAQSDAAHDIDAQVDELLRDIELNGSSAYALRTEPEADELNPDDIHPDDLADDDVADLVDADLAEQDAVDELPEALEVGDDAEMEEPEDEEEEVDEETRAEKDAHHRRRLRNFLILGIIVLLVLAGTIGLFMWRNSISSNVTQSDTEALSTGMAGTHTATFHPVDADEVPDLADVFGKTTDEAVAACNGQLSLSGDPSAATDPEIPALAQLVNGTLKDTNGVVIASIALGLDKDAHIVYVYAAFDLDALSVSGSTFEELAGSNVIASSLLTAVGLPEDKVAALPLDSSKDPGAIVASDKSAKEQAQFKGGTGMDAAPTSYKLTETYDHAVGKTLGDNSVMRTALVELW